MKHFKETAEFRIVSRRQLSQRTAVADRARLTEVIGRFGNGISLVKVQYLWPCFNCAVPVKVDYSTWGLLKSGMLLGIKCDECLVPPPTTGIVKAGRRAA